MHFFGLGKPRGHSRSGSGSSSGSDSRSNSTSLGSSSSRRGAVLTPPASPSESPDPAHASCLYRLGSPTRTLTASETAVERPHHRKSAQPSVRPLQATVGPSQLRSVIAKKSPSMDEQSKLPEVRWLSDQATPPATPTLRVDPPSPAPSTSSTMSDATVVPSYPYPTARSASIAIMPGQLVMPTVAAPAPAPAPASPITPKSRVRFATRSCSLPVSPPETPLPTPSHEIPPPVLPTFSATFSPALQPCLDSSRASVSPASPLNPSHLAVPPRKLSALALSEAEPTSSFGSSYHFPALGTHRPSLASIYSQASQQSYATYTTSSSFSAGYVDPDDWAPEGLDMDTDMGEDSIYFAEGYERRDSVVNAFATFSFDQQAHSVPLSSSSSLLSSSCPAPGGIFGLAPPAALSGLGFGPGPNTPNTRRGSRSETHAQLSHAQNQAQNHPYLSHALAVRRTSPLAPSPPLKAASRKSTSTTSMTTTTTVVGRTKPSWAINSR
ncbi:hypothetical protein EHS25_006818 [Saitozyma podzolica]|uniref:Uncharacterized protein n=1 Tax=Saitozyma podzolica TaxID=1890683 RepID=A0A427XRQ2_9TREE|nr:hypothetical protein EHS25_006818 [Saitozyma podzolica]